jgi:hypothetical protein
MTTKGRLTIKGENLSISKLNVDEGKLMVKGIINSLVFSEFGFDKNPHIFVFYICAHILLLYITFLSVISFINF